MNRGAMLGIALGIALLAFVAPIAVPQALAFPYHARSNGLEVWSETPLPQGEFDAVTARVAALVKTSPIALPAEPRNVFLTQGGWRWTWLALNNRMTFGLTRAVNEAVLINRSDLATDRVWNDPAMTRQRTLSGVIAHETCHGMERRRFGWFIDVTKPTWLREGYCDYVANESGLSDAEAARLKAAGQSQPALIYYDGRRRVAATLAANGGDVDTLFASD